MIALGMTLGVVSFALGAGLDCWAATVSQVTNTLSPRERMGVAPMVQLLDRAEQQLRADPRINALDGTRARVHRFVGHPASAGAPLMADASVWLHRRRSTWGPQCTLLRGSDYTHHAALSVQVNQVDPFYHLLASPQAASTDSVFPMADVVDTVQGVPVYGHREFGTRVLLLVRDDIAPFVPVDAERVLWRVNPALFARSTPGEVRVIALVLTMSDGADPQREAMERWLKEIDLRPWRALLTR